MSRYNNPFQGIDISVPAEFHDEIGRYCQTGGGRAVVDNSPFQRMVDMWLLSACVAARLGLEPIDLPKGETVKIIDGSIFSSDPWRIHALMLLAIAHTGEVEIVGEPRRIVTLINGFAVAGLPKVIAMLKSGDGDAIWNLSEEVEKLVKPKRAA